jgi:2',3'-cyclic-nucleotide 2'-phosphodiesterase (5'-nucleotidase family)
MARPSDRGTASLAVNEGAIAAAVADADIVMTSGGSLRREFEPGSFRRDLGLDGKGGVKTPFHSRAM